MKPKKILFNPKSGFQIPPSGNEAEQAGLAGATIGIHNNTLIIAGGSNFENGYPWKGGHKIYHTRIYILKKESKDKFIWVQPARCKNLDYPVAYGACVSMPAGVISIGGEDNKGQISKVFQLQWTGNDVLIKSLPDLPVPLSNSGATYIGSKIYLVGGIQNSYSVKSFLCFDFSEKDPSWRQLDNLPVEISNAIVVTQNDGTEECVYVLGGRAKGKKLSAFRNSIYKYSLSSGRWTHDGNIQYEDGKQFGLSAGTGVALGKNYIILFGGDKGVVCNKVEALQYRLTLTADSTENLLLQQKKDSLQENHPGFFRDVILYNTVARSMIKAGEVPGKTQVTTTAVEWDDMVFIPSGEIRPGVRTPVITVLDIKKLIK